MTIGEKIEYKIKQYSELYERLKEAKYPNAISLAKYDLILEKYIAERALEGLVAAIQESEKLAVEK